MKKPEGWLILLKQNNADSHKSFNKTFVVLIFHFPLNIKVSFMVSFKGQMMVLLSIGLIGSPYLTIG
ncbi:hypothetical protein ACE1TI_20760 [Alteribacillus sp. JSM 102045]|uniref:hypothetical protein n=1 Tax=Alteribacillus sp. JSM 102045 TaxID=1562101 RepID=UPI0035BF1141